MDEILKVLEHERNAIISITHRLSLSDSLAQVAEESAELAQAALKLRRCIDGTNPTPTSLHDAAEHFSEELADVLLSAYVAGFDDGAVARVIKRKIARWNERLRANDK